MQMSLGRLPLSRDQPLALCRPPARLRGHSSLTSSEHHQNAKGPGMIVCQDPRMAERAVIPLIITTKSLPFHCKLRSQRRETEK